MSKTTKQLTDQEIDDDLMEWGYLCPDKKVHKFGKLSEWKNSVKYMTCENCHKVTPAMAILTNK